MARQSGGQRRVRPRGLPTLEQARAERRRALVYGKVQLRGQMSPRFWLWSGVILAAFGVIYYKIWQGELISQKSAVMAKQRAVAEALSPRVVPFRDQIESWVQGLAGDKKPDYVADQASRRLLNSKPGVYLRLRLENAQSVEKIREAASESLLDGFIACLFVRKGEPNPSQGPSCRTSADCEPGLLCNEYSVCLPPPKPYNMRLAYQALRVLSTKWTDELHEAGSDLEVKAFERDLERVSQDDVPIAVRLLARATFFTLVLDEDPKAGLPEPLDDEETDEQRVQRAGHAARVGIWNLKTKRLLLRLRAQASGKFVPVGKKVTKEKNLVAAQQRQANSCSLALQVKRAIVAAEERAEARRKAKEAAAKAAAEADAGTEAEDAEADAGAPAPSAEPASGAASGAPPPPVAPTAVPSAAP